MKRLLSTLPLLALSCLVFAQAYDFPERNGITMSTDWIDNLILLNNMSEEPLPPAEQMLYKHAEAILACQSEKDISALVGNNRFQDFCKEYGIIKLGGPMLGDIASTSVSVWMRTVKPDTFLVKVKDGGKTQSFGPGITSPETDLSATVLIDGLLPDTEYEYSVFIGDREIDLPEGAIIKTLPEGDKTDTRVVFGSCFHRFGLGNMDQANTIISRDPDAFLGLGDIAVQDRNNSQGWHSLDFMARDLYPAWKKLAARVPVYALWDDHDYFDNDRAGIPDGYTETDREHVWNLFRFAWNNPSYGFGEEGKGVFFRTRIGSCDIITVDHRYFRSEQSYLGEKQMKWLEEQLLDCSGPFIILATGTMWSDYVSNGKDSWGRFGQEEREKIFSIIEKNNIKGVLLISGDRHGSRGFSIPRESGFNFYEFEVASLGGLAGQPATTPEWEPYQFYGINGGFAFGEFTFDTDRKDPAVTFRLIGDDGTIIHEKRLKRSELTPANY